MAYPIGFFEIQEHYARRVSAIIGITLEEALLNHTAYYRRIGIDDWKFDPTNPIWKAFCDCIGAGGQPAALALELHEGHPKDDATQRYGCMGYDCRETTIIMHFRNNQKSAHGPLSKHNQVTRLAELTEMFNHIFREHPTATHVEGFSWLYNYEAYRRLFPKEYTTAMELVPGIPVRLNSIWGQFIDHTGGMHQERTHAFYDKVDAATSIDELLGSFPFRVYKPRAEIRVFYSFYGVGA